jgi:hypothetical protein
MPCNRGVHTLRDFVHLATRFAIGQVITSAPLSEV